MSDMPDQIRAFPHDELPEGKVPLTGNWMIAGAMGLGGIEYTRADLYAALQAENERMQEALARIEHLSGLLETEMQGRIEASKLAAISQVKSAARAALQGEGDRSE